MLARKKYGCIARVRVHVHVRSHARETTIAVNAGGSALVHSGDLHCGGLRASAARPIALDSDPLCEARSETKLEIMRPTIDGKTRRIEGGDEEEGFHNTAALAQKLVLSRRTENLRPQRKAGKSGPCCCPPKHAPVLPGTDTGRPAGYPAGGSRSIGKDSGALVRPVSHYFILCCTVPKEMPLPSWNRHSA